MSTILQDKIVTTCKEQVCWGCEQTFEKGTRLRLVVEVDKNNIHGSHGTYWCQVCDATIEEQYTECFENSYGLGEVKYYGCWQDKVDCMPRTY